MERIVFQYFISAAHSQHVCSALLAASSTTGPESLSTSERDGAHLPSKNPSSWSIEEVMQFVRDADPTALAPHAELFRKHVSSFVFLVFSFGCYSCDDDSCD